MSRITTLDEKGVGIVTLGQEDAASGDTLRLETMCQPLRSLLAAAIGIDIEGEINREPSHSWRNWQALRWMPKEQVTWRKPACHNTA